MVHKVPGHNLAVDTPGHLVDSILLVVRHTVPVEGHSLVGVLVRGIRLVVVVDSPYFPVVGRGNWFAGRARQRSILIGVRCCRWVECVRVGGRRRRCCRGVESWEIRIFGKPSWLSSCYFAKG